ncbi:MAG: hypothetical protein MI862_04675, partial [Desulfobacterales bacterium]|nr:hypothetical protein [Desulfobacterales bacterium]
FFLQTCIESTILKSFLDELRLSSLSQNACDLVSSAELPGTEFAVEHLCSVCGHQSFPWIENRTLLHLCHLFSCRVNKELEALNIPAQEVVTYRLGKKKKKKKIR